MPICIECRYPVKTLYTEYSGADDRSSGHGVRLTVCKNCGRFCDKYVEHDFVVLFIDLVLIKPQVYRHLLHNTLMREHDQFDPIVFQYVFFLILCALSTLSFHLSIRFLTSSPLSPLVLSNLIPRYPRPNSVSTALLVSSSTKLFPILMVIWEYDVPAAARSLGWAVVANNVEALKILLDCGYGTAAILATVGAISRWMVGRGILWVAGLDGVDTVGDSGVASDGKALWAVVELGREWGGRLGLG
ncbi:Protein arv1 [Lachnellula cervina]|uniref:Protein ARV n=1 Tax=Lachnellula cervina TaxID=1316786 RepID=A0A7D8YYE7_9HELO|nr:Protein arv1 [Lachnellula cervina]